MSTQLNAESEAPASATRKDDGTWQLNWSWNRAELIRRAVRPGKQLILWLLVCFFVPLVFGLVGPHVAGLINSSPGSRAVGVPPPAIAVLGLLLPLVLFGLLFTVFVVVSVRSQRHQMAQVEAEPAQVVVGPLGVLRSGRHWERLLSWQDVTQVEDAGRLCRIVRSALDSCDIPGRVFASDAIRSEFVRQCQAWLVAANPQATPLAAPDAEAETEHLAAPAVPAGVTAVSYRLQAEDIRSVTRRFQGGRAGRFGGLWRYVQLIVVLGFCSLTILPQLLGGSRSEILGLIVPFVVACGLIFVRQTLEAKQLDSAGITHPAVAILTPEYLEMRQVHSWSRWQWAYIQKIEKWQKHIAFVVAEGVCLTIPREAFGSDAALQAFVAEAERYQEQAANGAPGASLA